MRLKRDERAPCGYGNATGYGKGCRCPQCASGNNERQRGYRVRIARGALDRVVSAEICRQHLCELAARGIGYRAVAAASDVPICTVQQVRIGRLRRVRESTERRLLRVTEDAIADFGMVDAAPTKQLIDLLVIRGYTKRELAKMLGYEGNSPQCYYNARIRACTALRVEKLYRVLTRREGDRVDQMMALARRVA